MDKLSEIDQLILIGKIAEARQELRKILGRKHNRSDKLRMASLARRVGAPDLSIKFLHKIVRGPGEQASSAERCEYGTSLVRLGYFREGDAILSAPNLAKNSSAILYSAFSDIYKWNYESAELKLKDFLKTKSNEHEQMVAEINLAACLVLSGRSFAKTKQVLEEIHEKAIEKNVMRLQANAMELLGQLYLYNDKFTEAENILDRAAQLLDANGSFDGSLIQMWQLFLDLRKNPQSPNSLRAVLKFREKARASGYWEIIRDCDFHLGIWNRNRSILENLYFGTPYPAYRDRILRLAGDKIRLVNDSYVWRMNQSRRPDTILDLNDGEVSGAIKFNESLLGQTQSLLLLRSLASDFYRPVRVSSLFESIYRDEYFDPFTTPNRVHQAVWRLRRQLKKLKVPLEIKGNDGFQLHSGQGFGLCVHLRPADFHDPLGILRQHFLKEKFSANQVADVLNISVRKAQMLLKVAAEEHVICLIGAGPSTRYYFNVAS